MTGSILRKLFRTPREHTPLRRGESQQVYPTECISEDCLPQYEEDQTHVSRARGFSEAAIVRKSTKGKTGQWGWWLLGIDIKLRTVDLHKSPTNVLDALVDIRAARISREVFSQRYLKK